MKKTAEEMIKESQRRNMVIFSPSEIKIFSKLMHDFAAQEVAERDKQFKGEDSLFKTIKASN